MSRVRATRSFKSIHQRPLCYMTAPDNTLVAAVGEKNWERPLTKVVSLVDEQDEEQDDGVTDEIDDLTKDLDQVPRTGQDNTRANALGTCHFVNKNS